MSDGPRPYTREQQRIREQFLAELPAPPTDDPRWWAGIHPQATLFKRWLVTEDNVDLEHPPLRRARYWCWTQAGAWRKRRREQRTSDMYRQWGFEAGIEQPARSIRFVVVDRQDDPRRPPGKKANA